MTDLQRLLEDVLDEVLPPYGSRFKKPIMDAWGRRVLAGEAHDKGRSCERTEEVLDNYRQRAIKAERVLAEGREFPISSANVSGVELRVIVVPDDVTGPVRIVDRSEP